MNAIALIPAIQWMAGIFLFSLAIYVLQYKNHPATKSLASFLFFAGFWSVAAASMMEFSTLEHKIIFNRVRLLAAVFIPYSIFLLAMRFSSYDEKKIDIFKKLFFIPIIFVLVIISPWHEYFLKNYEIITIQSIDFLFYENGPIFYVHNLLSRVVVVGALYLFLFKGRSKNGFQKKTSFLLVISIFVPFVVDSLGVLIFPKIRILQLVPVTLSFTGAVITYILFYHQALKMIPFGRSQIVSEIDYPCLMWDANGVLADANPIACTLFNIDESLKSPKSLEFLKDDHAKINIEKEVYEVRHFNIKSKTQNNYEGSFSILKNQTAILQNLEVKTKLVSILSHDIHGLVGQLLYLSDVMNNDQEKLSLDQRKKLASGIFEITSELNIFLKNTIDWSKDQFGNWKIKNKKIVVKELIETNLILLASLTKSKNLKLENYVTNEFVLETDETILNIILRNLIYNSIKHSQDNSVISIEEVTGAIVIKNPSDEKRVVELNNYFSHEGPEELSANGLGIRICRDFSRLIKMKISFNHDGENLITQLRPENHEKSNT